MCCYLVKGNITLLLFMQNAIIKYKGLSIIVIVVLHFNNLGMFEQYWSDMPRRRACPTILVVITFCAVFLKIYKTPINFSGASYMWKHCMYEIMSDLGKYLVNRYALCLKGSNMPRPPLLTRLKHFSQCKIDFSLSNIWDSIKMIIFCIC